MEPGQKKILIIGAAMAAAFVLLLVWLFASGTASGKVSVKIVVSPMDSTLTLDGKSVKAGTFRLAKGKHTVQGNRRYFDNASKTFDTNSLPATNTVFLILPANTEQAKAYLASHPEEQNIRDQAGGADFGATQVSILDKYPIVKQLPYSTLDYTIEYAVTEDKNVVFNVTLKPITTAADGASYKQELESYQKEAKDFLAGQGVDASKATITYNPDPAKL